MSKLDVIYEDNHIIAVNKPNNIPVQKDESGDLALEEIVKDYIKEKYNKPGEVFIGVVHRIDRPVSGMVIFARTSKALSRLNELFRDKNIKKTYWALVKNKPELEAATLINYIKRDTVKNKSYCHNHPTPDAKQAELSYKLIAHSQNYYLLEIDLKTGRHHQIRAQLANIGSPIKGDLKYGAKRSNVNGGIDLHSRSISFIHPIKKEPITIVAKVPSDKIWLDLERTVNENSITQNK